MPVIRECLLTCPIDSDQWGVLGYLSRRGRVSNLYMRSVLVQNIFTMQEYWTLPLTWP